MAKPLQPGYIYIDSEILRQRVALHEKSGWLFCEDKYPDGKLVSYSPQELKIIEESGEPISMEVHRVKRFFTGEVVDYDRRPESKNQGKRIEGTGPDNSNNISNPGGQIQGPSGNGPAVREGELDIF